MRIDKVKIAWFVVGCAVTGLVVFLLQVMLGAAETTGRIASKQATNSQKIDASEETLLLVRDCVKAGGKCFEDNQRRSAGIVDELNQGASSAAAAAASCADRPDIKGYREIKACVDSTLAEQRP